MDKWQFVMVYGFGIIGLGLGLGSFTACFLLRVFCFFSFAVGFLYPPLSFVFSSILFSLISYGVHCTESLSYALFIPIFFPFFFLKNWAAHAERT